MSPDQTATRERTLERRLGRALLSPWWLLPIAGIAWTLVALIVLLLDYTSVSSISLLFGFVAIAVAVVEIGVMFLARDIVLAFRFREIQHAAPG